MADSIKTKSKNKTNRKPGMKVSELSRLTGVSRQTVHFYLREGLLPLPTKTSKTMAYYNESHVERLRLIKRLQVEHRLQLAEIKELLDGGERLFQDEELLAEALSHERGLDKCFSRPELAKESGLTVGDIRKLSQMGIIGGEGKSMEADYGAADLEIARAFRGILDAGYPADYALQLLSLYRETSRELSKKEFRNFFDLSPMESDTDEIAAAYRCAEPHLERSFLILRRKALGLQIRQALHDASRRVLSFEKGLREGVQQVFLSPSYLKSLKFNGLLIDELKSRVLDDPEELASYIALQVIYYATGDTVNLLECSRKAVGVDTRHPWVLLFLGSAYVLNLRMEESLEVLTRCVELHPEFAMARCRLGGAMLMKAAREKKVVRAMAWARGALQEMDRSIEFETQNMIEYLMLHVSRGSALCLLPRFMGRFQEGMVEMEEALALAEIEKERAQDSYYTAVVDAILLNFYFYLGEAYEDDQRISDRDRMWKSLISIDPENKVADMVRERMAGEDAKIDDGEIERDVAKEKK